MLRTFSRRLLAAEAKPEGCLEYLCIIVTLSNIDFVVGLTLLSGFGVAMAYSSKSLPGLLAYLYLTNLI